MSSIACLLTLNYVSCSRVLDLNTRVYSNNLEMCQHDRIREFMKSKLEDIVHCDQLKIIFTPGTDQKNYFGSVYRVEVHNADKSLNKKYFIKTHGDDVAKNIRINIVEKFRREALAYNLLFKEYNKIQEKISYDTKIKFPICIHADDEFLILEDLTELSFKDVDHKLTLDLDHMILMIRNIAKFHAYSFALKFKKPEVFAEIRSHLKKPNMTNRDRRTVIVNKIWNWTMDAITDKKIKDKLLSSKHVFLLEYDNYDEADYVVISHGDYNMRNVLFHYDQDNKPDDLRMIDFQLCYVTSPIADLLFSIFSSTDSQLRRCHYVALQDMYYDSLKQNLFLLNCDVDRCYPEEIYRADFRKYFPREFITILVILRLMCIAFRDESVPAKSSETIFEYNSDEAEDAYRNRVSQVIDDFNRFGYI